MANILLGNYQQDTIKFLTRLTYTCCLNYMIQTGQETVCASSEVILNEMCHNLIPVKKNPLIIDVQMRT